MSDFPNLQPAFTMRVRIEPAVPIGSTARNAPFVVVPMVSGGSMKSEPGFSPSFNGEFTGTGNDYIRFDTDGKRFKLDAHGVIKTDDGVMLYLHYTGTALISPAMEAILKGTSEPVVTPFGNIFIRPTFETGDEKYASLESDVFVGAGHIIYEKDQLPIVEYKVSKACMG